MNNSIFKFYFIQNLINRLLFYKKYLFVNEHLCIIIVLCLELEYTNT